MPGKFNLEITLDNAAFGDDPRYEIDRILRVVADTLTLEISDIDEFSKTLIDTNGNRVGEAWCLWRTHEEEAEDS